MTNATQPLCACCRMMPVANEGDVCADRAACVGRYDERQALEERQATAAARIREAVIAGDFNQDCLGKWAGSSAAIEQRRPQMWQALRNWTPRPGSLYVHGDCGTGKTFACTAILREAAADNRSLALVPALRLADVAGRYDTPPSVVQRWGSVGVLLLDDLDKPRWTDTRLEVLYRVLDARASTHRATLVTANTPPSALLDKLLEAGRADLADAAFQRLLPMTVCELSGSNLRLARTCRVEPTSKPSDASERSEGDVS